MNKLALIAVSGAAAAALGGCVIVDADVRDSWDHNGDYGYLYGAEITDRPGEVTIVAHSNGCTQKEDFRFIVRDRGDDESISASAASAPTTARRLCPKAAA